MNEIAVLMVALLMADAEASACQDQRRLADEAPAAHLAFAHLVLAELVVQTAILEMVLSGHLVA